MIQEPRLTTDGGMDAAECRSLRNRMQSGASLDEVAESTNFRRHTVVKHLAGDCSHDHDSIARPIPRDEVLDRQPLSAQICTTLREEVREEETVMDYAQTVEYSYPTILQHVTGRCSHSGDVSPIETEQRSDTITADQCQSMRDQYRKSSEITFADIASERDYGEGTVERHILYRCSHPPTETLAMDVDEVHDILTSGPLNLGLAHEDKSGDPDRVIKPNQTDADLKENHTHAEGHSTSQDVPTTEAGEKLKKTYQYRCQVCGETRWQSDEQEQRDAEVRYLKPIGHLHNGPDDQSNMLVMCPDHYADLANGQLAIHPEMLRITHKTETTIDGTELTTAPSHHPDPELIRYHNKHIAEIQPSDSH